MTMAAVGHVASHAATSGAASQVVPSGKSDTEQQILLLLILAGVIIFIQSERSGKGLDGVQFAALGVVGFFLLVLAQFWAEVAFAFTILFVVSIILNSPKGIPLIGKGSGSQGTKFSLNPNEPVTQPTTVPPGSNVPGFNSLGNPTGKAGTPQ